MDNNNNNNNFLTIITALSSKQPVEVDVGGVVFHGVVNKINLKDGWFRLLDVFDTNWIKFSAVTVVTLLCINKPLCLSKNQCDYNTCNSSCNLPFSKLLTALNGTIVEIYTQGSPVDGIISDVDLQNGIVSLSEPLIHAIHYIPINQIDAVLQANPSNPNNC